MPLRIAMFSDSVFPILNGVSVSIDALVQELRNQGHSVHLFAPRCFGYRDTDPNTFRFRAVATPWAPSYPLAYPPFYRQLLRFRRNQYDVVHTHTPFAMGMVGLRWSESHEIPIVSTYHTLYDRYAHYLRWFPTRYARFRIAKHTNFYYNKVDHVITPSEAASKWLRRHSVNTPASVIPTGIRAQTVCNRAELRHELGFGPDQRVMLYVGRLAYEKNLGILIEMAKRVIATHPNTRLLLVGDGPFRAEATRLVRGAHIGDRVRFVGLVARSEVDRYYAASDLFVFPSITETQGLVVQEALGHGLPAVAVAGGGAGASIVNGQNGFVVKNDPGAFSEAVLEILDDPDLYEEMSKESVRSVRHLGIPKMTAGVLSAYEQAMGRHTTERQSARLALL